MAKKIRAAVRSRRDYERVPLDAIVGKTVESIGRGTIEGAFGKEPMTVLYFTDRTSHGFVQPSEE